MRKRIAIIDLGTNTFNILVLDFEEGKREMVYTSKVGVGLGIGGINEGKISADSADRGIKTLIEFKRQCDELEVDEIRGFGTSAIRNADNREEFIQRAWEESQISIKVISGVEEASYIYEGVRSGYQFSKPALIMDIGGGSTEFILANSEGVIKAKSFEIGVSRIYQQFQFSDPYSAGDRERIEGYLSEEIGDFFEEVGVDELIGASGSFETFFELVHEQTFPQGEYVSLSREAIEPCLEAITRSTQEERDKNDFIIPIRKQMAPIAAIKIQWILNKLNIQNIIISPFALKEGVIRQIQ
ncbi:MAG: hypothetical protein MI810_15545 [Flavobacteriales bacterium]|nr:hypothetical protein [Flavobacteriales bacterium]